MAKKEKEKVKEKVNYKNRDELIAAINSEYGNGAIAVMGSKPILDIPSISTGSATYDKALGIWGVPKGRIIEVYGPEGGGKTTLCLSIIKECQKQGGVAAFVDAEHALDPSWAASIGVDIPNLMLSQPSSGEEALNIVEMLAASGQVDLVVVDSVAALIPQAEIDGEMGDTHIGLQARLMSQGMRKLVGISTKSKSNTKCTIIFINQIRYKIGVMFGNPETTPGGNALKFYASVRLDLRRGATLKDGNELIGNTVNLKVVKNKVAPPFQKATADLYYGKNGYPSGFDYAGTLITLAQEAGIIELRGSSYSFGEIRLGQGRKNACDLVRNTPDLFEAVQARVKEVYQKSSMPVIKTDSEDDIETDTLDGEETQ